MGKSVFWFWEVCSCVLFAVVIIATKTGSAPIVHVLCGDIQGKLSSEIPGYAEFRGISYGVRLKF